MRVVTITRNVYKYSELGDEYARDNAKEYIITDLMRDEGDRIDMYLRGFRHAIEKRKGNSMVLQSDMDAICDDAYSEYADEFKLVYSKLVPSLTPNLQNRLYAADAVYKAFSDFVWYRVENTPHTEEQFSRCADSYGMEFFEDGQRYI
jgi:hypothetical protein